MCVASFPLLHLSPGPCSCPRAPWVCIQRRWEHSLHLRDSFVMESGWFHSQTLLFQGPKETKTLCITPLPPVFNFILFLNALKIVLVSFAAWTSNCMKCNNSHFRLKKKQKTPCVTLCSSLQWITLGNPTNDFFFSAKPE